MFSFLKLKNSFLEVFKLICCVFIGVYLIISLCMFLSSFLPKTEQPSLISKEGIAKVSYTENGKKISLTKEVVITLSEDDQEVLSISLKDD